MTPLPTRAAIETAFIRDPALFIFRYSDPANPPRAVGGRDGAALEINGPPDAPASISLAVVVPPDNLPMAERGGIFLMLLLSVVDKEWMAANAGGGAWLTGNLRISARDPRTIRSVRRSHNGRLYQLTTDRARSLATLTITPAE